MATVTKTIGTDSRDYATIVLWEADLAGASGGAGNDAVGEMYNDSAFDEKVSFSDATPDSIKLTVADGERHDGTAGSGARVVLTVSGGGNHAWFISSNMTIEWLELDGSDLGTNSLISISATVLMRRCIFHNIARAGAACKFFGVRNGSKYVNNIIYSALAGTTAYGIAGSVYSTVELYNNTVYKMVGEGVGVTSIYGIGISDSYVTNKFRNNISVGHSAEGVSPTAYTNAAPSNATVSNNIADDSTAGGSGSINNVNESDLFVSIAVGSEDLHLKNYACALRTGVDLGTTVDSNVDIDGRDRDAQNDTWDIGADQAQDASRFRQAGTGSGANGFYGWLPLTIGS